MALTYFICQDGQTRKVSECLDHCPLPNGRCLSLPTLADMGHTRRWNGMASTTQCLNPTRYEYLSITKPFAVDPFDQAFALLGTRHHQRLESVAKKIAGLESEKKLTGEVSGILDLLEPINGGEHYRLIDYKTFGSFALGKLIGVKLGDYEIHKLALQLNNYRLMVEALGFHVTELKAQVTVRDGGTFSAKHNGFDRNLYMVPVQILPDDEVQEYFLTKSFALQQAMKTGVTELCNFDERWGGRRCHLPFCQVCYWCPEGAKVNKVTLRED